MERIIEDIKLYRYKGEDFGMCMTSAIVDGQKHISGDSGIFGNQLYVRFSTSTLVEGKGKMLADCLERGLEAEIFEKPMEMVATDSYVAAWDIVHFDLEPKSNEDKREKYFQENNLECSCRPGFVVCNNCVEYYNKIKNG